MIQSRIEGVNKGSEQIDQLRNELISFRFLFGQIFIALPSCS